MKMESQKLQPIPEDVSQDSQSRMMSISIKNKRLGDSIDPEVAFRNNFEKFINDLEENFNKLKFRKCLDDIRDKENIFNSVPDKWKIIELKIKSLIKIINKKFSKYSGTNSSKLKTVEEWIRRLDEETTKWIDLLFKSDETSEEFMHQFELILQATLEFNYSIALQLKNDKQIADCIGFLALGERLIKFCVDFTNNPETLNISAKILLFISSLLIADKDFSTSKTYAANTLRISYRELYFKFEIEEGISLSNLNKTEITSIEKIFMNMIISFYHIGVCEENLGNINLAIEAYKQAKWFSNNFVKNSMPDLCQFLSDVNSRAITYYNLIKYVKENQHNFREFTKNEKKNKKPKIFYDELNNMNKFENTKKTVEKIKLEELEDDDLTDMQNKKSQNIKKILSTVRTINHFMSDNFRDIVNSMDKIEVTKFDKTTKEKVQKKLNEIKADHIYNQKEQIRKSILKKEKLNLDIINNFTTSPYTKTEYTTSPAYNSTTENNKYNMTMRLNSSTTGGISGKYLNKTNDIKSTRPFTSTYKHYNLKFKEDTVEKYNHSEYIFDTKYRKKLSYLDKLCHKEFDFQKKNLTLKRNEKLFVDEFDRGKVADNCETFFTSVLMNKAKILKDDENINKKKELLNEQSIKLEKEKDRLEMRVLKSLSTKAYDQFKTFKSEYNKQVYRPRKINEQQTDINQMKQKNKDCVNKIENQLKNFKNIEEFIKRDLNPHFKEDKQINKNPVFNKYNSDNFIKKTK